MKSEDLDSINGVITQFFQVFDNRGGQTPDFSIMDQLLLPSLVIHKIDNDQIQAMDLATFLQPRIQLFETGQIHDFHEWETDSHTTINGQMASRISSYSKSGQLNGVKINGSGKKHFQLLKTAKDWQIAAVIWQDD